MPDDLDHLRYLLLRHCLPGGQSIGSLAAHPDFRPYAHRLLRQMLYSLHWAGLLDKYGETSGTTYITTHLGYIVLVALRPHETFDDKP